MILICAYFQKNQIVAGANFQTYFRENLINFIVDYCSSIFCWKYNVIQQYRNIVAVVDRFTHSPIVQTPQAAGYLTQENRIKSAPKVDLLLTDLVMPDGLNGFELADRVRSAVPDIKVVYMSGHPPDMISEIDLAGDNVAILPKPFDHEVLARTLRDVMSG